MPSSDTIELRWYLSMPMTYTHAGRTVNRYDCSNAHSQGKPFESVAGNRIFQSESLFARLKRAPLGIENMSL